MSASEKPLASLPAWRWAEGDGRWQPVKWEKWCFKSHVELLFRGYDPAKQPCIESGPSDDLKNAEKHHEAAKTDLPVLQEDIVFPNQGSHVDLV